MTLYEDSQVAADAAAAKVIDDALLASQTKTEAVQAKLDAALAAIANDAIVLQALKDADLKTVGDLKTADAATLAALQTAFDAYKVAHPDLVQYLQVSDFALSGPSAFLYPTGYTGKGMDQTIMRMLPKTSTKTAPTTGTNQLRVVRAASPSSGSVPTNVVLRDFTVEGTDQGEPYNGIMVMYAKSPLVERVKVTGIPGYASGPPGETFSLQFWHSDGPTTNDCVLDGRNAAGTPVAATLASHNGNLVNGATHNRLTMEYAQFGFATAMFQNTGHFTYNTCLFAHCRKAVNIEDTNGGIYDFNNCTFTDIWGAGYVAQVSSKSFGAAGSAVVNFRDCISPDADGILRVRTYPTSGGFQKDSDIHCFINGKEVTNDPTKFLIVHTG